MVASTSTGLLCFFHLQGDPTCLRFKRSIRVDEPSSVITSFSLGHGEHEDEIVFTSSTGAVRIIRVEDGIAVHEGTAEVHADFSNQAKTVFEHSQEAWIAVFGPPSWPYSIFSGGDDAVLQQTYLDHTALSAVGVELAGSWQTRRFHSAGVIAILPLTLNTRHGTEAPLFLLTGSYDDNLRLLAMPQQPERRVPPVVMGEWQMDGGVWKIKIMNLSKQENSNFRSVFRLILLVSCMYAGARIVEVGLELNGDLPGDWTCKFKVLAKFTEHDSICYAADYRPLTSAEEPAFTENEIVSCSFYDRKLCLWSFRHSNT